MVKFSLNNEGGACTVEAMGVLVLARKSRAICCISFLRLIFRQGQSWQITASLMLGALVGDAEDACGNCLMPRAECVLCFRQWPRLRSINVSSITCLSLRCASHFWASQCPRPYVEGVALTFRLSTACSRQLYRVDSFLRDTKHILDWLPF